MLSWKQEAVTYRDLGGVCADSARDADPVDAAEAAGALPLAVEPGAAAAAVPPAALAVHPGAVAAAPQVVVPVLRGEGHAVLGVVCGHVVVGRARVAGSGGEEKCK